MKPADWISLVVVIGALALTGLDKLETDALLALLGGILLRSPLDARKNDQAVVD